MSLQSTSPLQKHPVLLVQTNPVLPNAVEMYTKVLPDSDGSTRTNLFKINKRNPAITGGVF
tara:strand:+ start:27092 stop:27274 length:183 start_codon:yes stop_codon:yes gene_type:complete